MTRDELIEAFKKLPEDVKFASSSGDEYIYEIEGPFLVNIESDKIAFFDHKPNGGQWLGEIQDSFGNTIQPAKKGW